MLKPRNKYEYYDYLKNVFEEFGAEVSPYREISYGLQFSVSFSGGKHIIRIYESKKKGVSCDLSQIKDRESLSLIEKIMRGADRQTVNIPMNKSKAEGDPEIGLIGIDESGKGDYFGPLVIAGVYANADIKSYLEELGAADSKTLSDARIRILAQDIARVCRYSVITIENERYNEMYNNFRNLNRLLAWGHASVIESMLEVVECSNVLSDQFGSPELIEDALLEKGMKINLEQRPRAEENVVVAAASILARNEYVKAMDSLSLQYGMGFPKGCSAAVKDAAREFVRLHGKARLAEVAKLHFVITEKI